MRKYYAIRNRKNGDLLPHYQSRTMPAIYLHLKTAESVLKKLQNRYRTGVGTVVECEWEAVEVDIVPARRQLIEAEIPACGHDDY